MKIEDETAAGRRAGRMGSGRTRRRTAVALGTAAALTIAVTAVQADSGLTDSVGTTLGGGDATAADGDRVVAALAAAGGQRETVYPGTAFRPRDTTLADVDGSGSSGCYYATGGSLLTTPVHLPDGARVESMTVYAQDNASFSVTAYLTEWSRAAFPGSAPSFNDIFTVSTSGTPGNTEVSDSTPDSAGNAIIDNDLDSYALQVSAGDTDARVCAVKLVWTPPPGEVFHPVTPCTIYDVRPGLGGREKNLGARETVTVDVLRPDYSVQGGESGNCGVPQTNGEVTAVALSVNVHGATASGGVRMWPNGASSPTAQSLVIARNAKGSVNAAVEVGASQSIRVRNNTSGFMALELVVTGYYTAPS